MNFTAYDLGIKMATESIYPVKNPYDPDCTDYDDFNEGVYIVRRERNDAARN